MTPNYISHTPRHWTLFRIAENREATKQLSTDRGLDLADLELFCDLVRANPHKRVRVYSRMGFVANAYRWPVEIWYVERDRQGRIHFRAVSAKRPMGRGPHATINSRDYRNYSR